LADQVRELVSRCLSGDTHAVVELVDRFRGQVFGLCLRMLRHREDAEDMTQEAFVRAIRNLGRWDPQREFTPWLLAIAGNRCRTLMAARMRRPPGSIPVEALADRTPDPWGERSLCEEVQRALAGLRDEYRTAFLLFHEQELSYQEIAAALNCPLGTVKTWVHRARRDLARELIRRGVVEGLQYAVR
jgi:RNA polymerase sigma-70 factor (ECF subfamily)